MHKIPFYRYLSSFTPSNRGQCSKLALSSLLLSVNTNASKCSTLLRPLYTHSNYPQHSSPPLPSNIIFRAADPQTFTSAEPNSLIHRRPLSLSFAWMSARNAHLEKYRQFWTARGYDILTITTQPKDLLFPPTGTVKFSRELVHFLANRPHPYEKIVFHNFSVGTFVSTVFRHQLNRAINRGLPGALAVRNSFQGLILDSLTFLSDSPRGTAKAATENPIGQLAIKSAIIGYYMLIFPYTISQYLITINVLKSGKLPVLVLYSEDDSLTDSGKIRRFIDHLKGNGVKVWTKVWDTSPHVQHFRVHNQEYVTEVETFLGKIGMPS